MAVSGTDLAKATDSALKDPEVKNLVYGEIVHAKNDFFRQFTSPENLGSLKRNNVTEIAIELPQMLQFTVDSLIAGRMTPDRFKANMKGQFEFFGMDADTANERRDLIVDMILRAKERGITVKFVDSLKGTQEMAELLKPENQDKITKCVERKIGVLTEAELERMAEDVVKSASRLTAQCLKDDPDINRVSEKFAKDRMEDDKSLGADAAKRNPNSRTVFFYGNAHGEGIASGHPGKSVGIVGLTGQDSDAVRKMTPFFYYHFDTETGKTQTPSILQRLFGAAPAPVPALQPA